MSKFASALRTGLIAAGAMAMTGFTAQAATDTAAKPADQPPGHLEHCFYIRDWENWRAASGRDDVIYLRVRMHDVYKIELSNGTSLIHWPDVHIVNEVIGPDSVCYPIDLTMSISDGRGFHERLLVKSIAQLTPAEVAALPKDDRP